MLGLPLLRGYLYGLSTQWGRYFDLPRHSHYSGRQGLSQWSFNTLSGGRDFDLPRHSHYSDTQGLDLYGPMLWSFNTVGGEILTSQIHSHYSGVISMVFQHAVGGEILTFQDRETHSPTLPNLSRHEHSGLSERPRGLRVLNMRYLYAVFQHSVPLARNSLNVMGTWNTVVMEG